MYDQKIHQIFLPDPNVFYLHLLTCQGFKGFCGIRQIPWKSPSSSNSSKSSSMLVSKVFLPGGDQEPGGWSRDPLPPFEKNKSPAIKNHFLGNKIISWEIKLFLEIIIIFFQSKARAKAKANASAFGLQPSALSPQPSA